MLYTKNIHFMYKEEVYIQIDGAVMGAALTPVSADVFMVELKRSTIPIFCKKWDLLDMSYQY